MTAGGTVIFDLGRVLVDIDFARGLFARLVDVSRDPPVEVGQNLTRDRLLVRLGTGQISPAEFHRELCRRAGLDLTFDDFARQWCDVFSPMDGMETLFRDVAGRVPVGLLSDTDPLHWRHLLSTFPILRQIPKPTLSFETGVLKPAPESYLAAARNVGVAPENCLFTDDVPANVEGAQRVGMDAILFRSAADLRRHLEERRIL